MSHHTLSRSESERLECLIEECGETIQAATKILRHGYASHHPDRPEGSDNREMLENELAQVLFWTRRMAQEQDLSWANVRVQSDRYAARVAPYLHHQPRRSIHDPG